MGEVAATRSTRGHWIARPLVPLLFACSGRMDTGDTPPGPPPRTPSADALAREPDALCGAPGTTTPPSPVADLVAADQHTCARLEDGSVWCWGARGRGLVDNDVIDSRPCAIATRIDELAGSTRVVNDCAIRADDTMRCADVEGGSVAAAAFVPPGLRGVAEERATRTEVCRRRGTVATCTREAREITLHDQARRIAPAARGGWWIVTTDGGLCVGPAAGCREEVDGPSHVVDVATSDRLECVVDAAGVVWCADHHSPPRQDPGAPWFTKVEGVAGATRIAVGHAHACAITKDGVTCWGANGCGQSGAETTSRERCGAPDVGPTVVRWAK